jgi:hypothetical protein
MMVAARSLNPLVAIVDIAAWPVIDFQYGQDGRFNARRGYSPDRGKRKFLFLEPNFPNSTAGIKT